MLIVSHNILLHVYIYNKNSDILFYINLNIALELLIL